MDDTEPKIVSDEEPNVESVSEQDGWEDNYLPFRSSAAFAMILAVFSFIGLVFPVLTFFSAISLIFSLFVLRGFGKPVRYSGLGFAQFALLLSTMALVFLVCHQQSRKWYIHKTAKEHSEEFAEAILDGEAERSFEYSRPPFDRTPKDADLLQYYRDLREEMDSKMAFRIFLGWCNTPPLSVVWKDGAQGELQFIGFHDYARSKVDANYEQVGCDYVYRPANSLIPEMEFRVVMLRRNYRGNADIHWQIRRLKMLNE